MIDFAILAPVPVEHLESGLEVQRTHSYVSFASMKWQLFRTVDELRSGQPVPVLFYGSHDSERAELTYEIGWIARYIGHVEDYGEKRADERAGHRPPTTQQYPEDNAEHWAVFWRVQDVRPLPPALRMPIRNLESYKTGYWRKNTAPFGPEIVAAPDWFESVMNQTVAMPAIDIGEPPPRVQVSVNRIVRDTVAAQRLKQHYENACQICGLQLALGQGRTYAEVHHIRPLGGEHGGTDNPANMLVLCPNHHAQFDYGLPRFLSEDEVEIGDVVYPIRRYHDLELENIRYHNEAIHAFAYVDG